MKKYLLIAVMAVLSVAYAAAQPRAIGGRLGYGVEFSYEHTLGQNMLSVDAGVIAFNGIEAAVTYDWINPFGADFSSVWDKKGEWNWYMGVGAGAGLGGWNAWKDHYFYSFVGVAGRVGVEYNFWFPLQLSVDWRPLIGPSFSTDHEHTSVGFNMSGLYAGAICLGVRYKF